MQPNILHPPSAVAKLIVDHDKKKRKGRRIPGATEEKSARNFQRALLFAAFIVKARKPGSTWILTDWEQQEKAQASIRRGLTAFG
jgi:hypothetical protein